MIRLLALAALAAALVACSPTVADPGLVETAVAATMAAQATPTPAATETPLPTATPEATPTPEATAAPLPCAIEHMDYFDAYTDIHGRWMDAKDIAETAPRMNLAGPVAELQNLRRDLDRLYPPECGETLHQTLLDHMNFFIQSIVAYMRDADSLAIQPLNDLAMQELSANGVEMRRLTAELDAFDAEPNSP